MSLHRADPHLTDESRSKLLAVRDLHVTLMHREGAVEVVRGLDLDVQPTETLAVIGESGSGKSVSASAVARLLPDTARITGQVDFAGHDMLAAGAKELLGLRGDDIAYVFQDPTAALNPRMTVGAQVAELFALHRGQNRKVSWASAVEALRAVGIADVASRAHDYPHQFSGGMRQRVMIAMAVALSPRLLIADEPTTALDVTVQAQILQLLRRVQAESGMAMIFITHDLALAADIGERVAVMYAGQLVEQGPAQLVYQHPRHPYTRALLASRPHLGAMGERLSPIPGTAPPPDELPSGCAFRTRCAFATEVCAEVDPALAGVDHDQHDARCHHWSEVKDR